MSTEMSRLRWRCRRGMRELDQLLETYLRTRYAAATPAEQEAFRQLLELADPVIYGWLLGREQPPRGPMSDLVKHILARPLA